MQLTAVLKSYAFRGFQQTLSRAMNAFGFIEGVKQPRILAAGSFRALRPSAGASYCILPVTTSRPLQLRRNTPTCRNFASSKSKLRTDAQPLLVDPDALRLPRYCAGCGVGLQAEDPDLPGYYKIPKRLLEEGPAEINGSDPDAATEASDSAAATEGSLAAEQDERRVSQASASGRDELPPEDEAFKRFDRIIDDWLVDEEPQMTVRDLDIAAAEEESDEARILCARCYSLSHYGRVNSKAAEASLPQFDLGKRVGRKIGLQKMRRAVVLVVVDAADFDGSLPRAALEGLFSNIEGYQGKDERQQGQFDRDMRLVLAVNKADLLPQQATATRLEAWIRRRARQGGMPRPAAVMLVSALKGSGVDQLLIRLHREVGANGDVWVVGAQNAGKSSLINAMRRAVGHGKPREELTTAPLPGTTLGVLKVPGLMPPRCKMFDTPGVPHAHQLSSRLDPEEVKMLLPRKRLKPRTFRAAIGQTIFVGGVLRMDVLESPGETVYATVWASEELVCHLGKTEGADERVPIEGNSWRESSADIAVAGLGWLGIGVKGRAAFHVWTPEGVAITTREAVLPDFAREFERPGFSNKEQQKKVKGKSRSK